MADVGNSRTCKLTGTDTGTDMERDHGGSGS